MSRRQHVAILVANLPAERDRRVIRESLSLENAGYEVTIIAPRGDKTLRTLPGSRNVRLKPYPVHVYGAGVLSFAWEFLWSFLCISRAAARRGAGGPGARGAGVQPAGRLLAAGAADPGARPAVGVRPPRPVPRGLRDPGRREPNRTGLPDPRAFEWLTLRTATRVVATNESFRDNALRRGVADRSGSTVVRNGPARAEIAAGEPGDGRARPPCTASSTWACSAHRTTSRARCSPRRSSTRLRGRDDWRLIVAGDGETMPALRETRRRPRARRRGGVHRLARRPARGRAAARRHRRHPAGPADPDEPPVDDGEDRGVRGPRRAGRGGRPDSRPDAPPGRRRCTCRPARRPSSPRPSTRCSTTRRAGPRMREVGLARFAETLAWEHQARGVRGGLGRAARRPATRIPAGGIGDSGRATGDRQPTGGAAMSTPTVRPDDPRASVVIAAHNEEAVIGHCLDALLADAAPGDARHHRGRQRLHRRDRRGGGPAIRRTGHRTRRRGQARRAQRRRPRRPGDSRASTSTRTSCCHPARCARSSTRSTAPTRPATGRWRRCPADGSTSPVARCCVRAYYAVNSRLPAYDRRCSAAA